MQGVIILLVLHVKEQITCNKIVVSRGSLTFDVTTSNGRDIGVGIREI